MTRCEHIRKLNPPYTPTRLSEIHDILTVSDGAASGYAHSYPPYGRYTAEFWIMNDAGDIPGHDKPVNEWPYLQNNNYTEFRTSKPLIKKENVCSRHPPFQITKEKS